MYMREMPNSFFSHLLERVYVRGVHNSDTPLEKKYRSYKLGMTLLTVAYNQSPISWRSWVTIGRNMDSLDTVSIKKTDRRAALVKSMQKHMMEISSRNIKTTFSLCITKRNIACYTVIIQHGFLSSI